MTYEEYLTLVKNKIVAVLEKGINPWQAPWQPASNGLSGRPYSGTNSLYLSMLADEKFEADPRYYTFDQVKKMGNSVKKNERSAPAVFFQDKYLVDKKDQDGKIIRDANGKPEKIWVKGKPILKIYPVFNAKQLQREPELKENFAPTFDKNKAEQIIKSSPVVIQFSSLPRAFYSPETDMISMPSIASFNGNAEEYYSTAFHEMTHSTGPEIRLDRFQSGVQDPKAYAREELVAEISSLGLCDKCGAKYTNESSAAYIGYWKEMLQDPSFNFAELYGDVSKATRFLEHPEDRDKLIENTQKFKKTKEEMKEEKKARKEEKKAQKAAITNSSKAHTRTQKTTLVL